MEGDVKRGNGERREGGKILMTGRIKGQVKERMGR